MFQESKSWLCEGYFCLNWHSRSFLFKAALYGFPSSMLQMPKPFANPQTYQEMQYKASRGKKNQFQDRRANILQPHSPLESCPNPCSSPKEEPRARVRVGGCWGQAAAEKDPQEPRGTNMQPPQEAERKPRGRKFRNSSALQQEHTAGHPCATAALSASAWPRPGSQESPTRGQRPQKAEVQHKPKNFRAKHQKQLSKYHH